MLYKKIVKKGVTDLTFIQNILSEKLQDKSIIEINVSEKFVNNILKKYGRIFKSWNSKNLSTEHLIYNDEKYSFYLNIEHSKNGKYGCYYEMTISDNKKLSEQRLNKAIEDFKKYDLKSFEKDNIDVFEIGYYDVLLELLQHDLVTAFNPFSSIGLTNNTSLTRVANNFEEERKSIIDRLDKIAEENGDFYYYKKVD